MTSASFNPRANGSLPARSRQAGDGAAASSNPHPACRSFTVPATGPRSGRHLMRPKRIGLIVGMGTAVAALGALAGVAGLVDAACDGAVIARENGCFGRAEVGSDGWSVAPAGYRATAAELRTAGIDGPRLGEAIVVRGEQITALLGVAIGDIAVARWVGDRLDVIPHQLDQRMPDGTFTAVGDGFLNAADELVILMESVSSASAAPPGSSAEGFVGPALRLDIADPLDDEIAAVAYVLRRAPDAEPAPPVEPLLTWDPAERELRSETYVLGFPDSRPEADGFFGIDRLSLFGDEADRLDRMKFRGAITTPLGSLDLTEEDLGSLGDIIPGAGGGVDLDIEPVIVGPVRAVLDPQGAGLAYPRRAALFRTLDGFELPDLGGVVDLELADLRLSLDLSPYALERGATYRDANIAEAVPVNGEPDAVPPVPLPAWREITFDDGRAVLLATGDPGEREAAPATVYYADAVPGPSGDTGDGDAYGDQGVSADGLEDLAASGFPGELVVLPRGLGVSASELAAALFTPLLVTVGPADLDLPDAPEPTATSTPEPTGTPEPTSETPPPSGAGMVWLPWANASTGGAGR